MFLFVFYFQGAQSNTPIEAGIKLIPLALGMLVASPLAGIYADRHGSRSLAALGMLVSAAGLAAMTTLGVHTPYWQSGAVAAARRRRLGHVQQPQHRRDDGHRARPTAAASPRARARCCRTPAPCCRSRSCSRSSPRPCPKPTLFAVFSGLTKGLSEQKLAPFIANMHVALWVLAATSLLGRLRLPAAPQPHVRSGVRHAVLRGASASEHHARVEQGSTAARREYTYEPPRASEPSLRIGDVARLVGTTPRTIRYYEEIGLLPEAPARPVGPAPPVHRGRGRAPARGDAPEGPARGLARGAQDAAHRRGGARRGARPAAPRRRPPRAPPRAAERGARPHRPPARAGPRTAPASWRSSRTSCARRASACAASCASWTTPPREHHRPRLIPEEP